MSIMTVVYAVTIIFGVYLIVSAFYMKKSGNIGTTIITKEELADCKDTQGFISFIFWKEAVLGIAFCSMGILGLVNEFVIPLKGVRIVELVLFLGAFLWFQSELGKARKKFCS